MKATPYVLLAAGMLAIVRAPEAAPDPKPAPSPPAVKPGQITGSVVFFKDGNEEKPPSNAFVYLIPLRGTKLAMTPVTRAIRQYKQDFSPSQLVIPTGSTVAFPNDDRIDHNVFSPSYFNLMKYRGGCSKSRVFDKPGEYDIYCDIHVNMRAKVKVVDSDQIAPIVDGTYTFSAVPPGTYKLVAWAPNSAEVFEPTKIVVAAGQVVTMPDPLNLQPKPPPASHSHWDGTRYNIHQ